MNTRTSRYGRFGLVAPMVLIIPFLSLLSLTRPAGATIKAVDRDKGVTWTETLLGWQAVITLPSLTGGSPNAADTAAIPLDLSRRLNGYAGANGVPTWRTIYAMSAGDSMGVETYCGRTAAIAAAKIFKLNALANQNYHLAVGVPKANDVTLYPFPYWYLYVVNRGTSGSKTMVLTLFFPRPLLNELEHPQF